MNFIIELLPKKENLKEFVYVVRQANGFPISVCDSLCDACDVLQVQIDKLLIPSLKKDA